MQNEASEPIYRISIEPGTIGCYGKDEQGVPWVSFEIMNGTALCSVCGQDITSGWERGRTVEAGKGTRYIVRRMFPGEERFYACARHVQAETKEVQSCEDFEAQNMWDTSLCCAYCHGVYAHGDDHEMRVDAYQGHAILVCLPLYEQLFQGAAHFEPQP